MKKKLNIVLLLLVLCLWGTVLYKYVNQYFIKKGHIQYTTAYHLSGGKIMVKDTFELKSIERDPFLNNIIETKSALSTTRKIYVPIKHSPKELPKLNTKIPFPNIQYYGYIKALDKSKENILISRNGKFMKLSLNEAAEGLKIIKLSNDSIKVDFNKESKWFVKSKK